MEHSSPTFFVRFAAFVRILNRIFEMIAIGSLFGISALIFAQILLRNLFSIGLPWLEEMARFLHIALVFLTVPVLLSEDGHIRIDFLNARLNPRWQGWLYILILALCVVFATVFLVSDVQFFSGYWDVPSAAMNMPNIIFFGSAFIGMAGLLLNGIERIIHHIFMKHSKDGANAWAD